MKPIYFYQLLFALFISSAGYPAENVSAGPVLISGTKFTYPLIEKWIAEFKKGNPDANITLVSKTVSPQTADLNVIAHQPTKEDFDETQEVVYAGRYALLPVTNSRNPLLATLAKKGLSKKDIDKLFFERVNFDEEPGKEKPKFPATIYSRDNTSVTSTTLAGYFGHVSSEIRGKKVFGEDIYLLSAIKKDSIGLTYNNLGYLFDTDSRKLKDGIALLPLELKKDTKQILAGDLDLVIDILEKTQIETIPVEKIGFIYSKQTVRKEVSDFLKWVLTDGQKFNHAKGFLNLDNTALSEQTNRIKETLITLK
jgi:phosphate transport system substrate-binding protein